MNDFWSNPYTLKILLSMVPLLVKEIFKQDENLKGFYRVIVVMVYYLLPTVIIIWINLDDNISNSKLTNTIIAFNIGILIYNHLHSKLATNYNLLIKFTKSESNKVEEINRINETQSEKVKAVINNQNYILNEISKINDRIIKYFAERD